MGRLPVNKIAALLLFAFAVSLSMATIVVAELPPGVVVDYSPPSSGIYLGDPSIAILPNGDYIASHDAWGSGHPYSQTYVFRSQDQGQTWAPTANLYGQFASGLFVHNNELYILGGGGGGADVSIRKSADGGLTWTVPNSSVSGQLLANSSFACGATPAVVHDGRIWRAMEIVDPSIPPGASREFRSFMMSAPVDADLLGAASWTFSNSLLQDDYQPGYGWLEGNAVVDPVGDMKIVLRAGYYFEKAAIIDISADGTTASFNTSTGIIDFPGGGSKFTIRYDEASGRYWSLANKRTDPDAVRNVLALTSSADLVNWTVESTILYHPDSDNVGFQYADWQFEGADIVAVSRTAYDGAPNFHDSNYITFHRVKNFRSLSQIETTVLDAVGDAEIDQHVNYNNAALGMENSIRVEIRDTTYQNPVESPQSWGLLKWDLSNIDVTDTFHNATLRIIQCDGAVDSVEVYAILDGGWDESTVTWNNWVGTESVELLGIMQNVSYNDDGGVTTFSNEAFNELVENWIDGDQENYGLLLKWAGDVANGDTYITREHETLDPPRLIIETIPGNGLLAGDANGDGTVDDRDATVLASNWNASGADWSMGDFNGDGTVDRLDADELAGNWRKCLGGSPQAAVPEPGFFVFVFGAVLILPLRCRFSQRLRG